MARRACVRRKGHRKGNKRIRERERDKKETMNSENSKKDEKLL